MAEIRALGPEDVRAYRDLRLEALETEPLAFGSSAGDFRLLDEDVLRKRLEASDASFTLGAFIGETLVGIVGFSRNRQERDRGDVVGMYVVPEGRGRGIGRALLAALLDRVRGQEGLGLIDLGVATQCIAARALYRSQGFVPLGIEPQAIKHGDAYADVELMTLDLRSA